MTHNDYNMLRNDYKNILGILQNLGAYFKRQKPVSTPSSSILYVITDLEDANSAGALPRVDKTAVKVFAEDVRLFCNLYSESQTAKKRCSTCQFREPNENRDMQNSYQELHQQFQDLKINLNVSVRNLKAEYRVSSKACVSYSQVTLNMPRQA